jgi:homoserine kinase
MMTKDLFHQPYRAMLVPELSGVEQTAIQQGAYGVALSGAGPTVLVLTEKGKGQLMKEHLSQSFPNCEVDCVHVPATGSTVCKENVIRPLNSNQSI